MHDLVDQVLAERQKRRSQRGLVAGVVSAALLHLTAVVALLLWPGEAPQEPLEFVAVQAVPLSALGVPEPPPQPARRPEPEPEPQLPEPEPEPPPERQPPSLPPPEPAPRSEPEPPPRRSPPAPAPATPRDDNRSGDATGRAGSPQGDARGLSPFGARIDGVDPDFKYDYYLDRMLSLIEAAWVRPPVGGEVRAVLRYTVERSGEITDIELVESSGHNAFDLAALRAVRNAGPLPALPVSYRRDQLRVTLIVR